jgi:hypothetical protein
VVLQFLSIKSTALTGLTAPRHTLISQVLNIEHCDLDALLGKQLDDNLADAITTTRHNHDLAAPHIGVIGKVVCDSPVEPGADLASQAKRERRLQILEGGGILACEHAALGCVLCKEKQRQRQGRVERRELEESTNCVTGDT